MAPTESAEAAVPRTSGSHRKDLGDWYTPRELIHILVQRTVDRTWVEQVTQGGVQPLRVLDPACGDGRLLAAVRDQVADWGIEVDLTGVDIDAGAVAASRARLGPGARILHADALTAEIFPGDDHASAHLFIANPPFISQMSARTSRGGSSARGGGPYADVAAEFCALALEVTAPAHGRIAVILPQSFLTVRDAAEIRARIDARSRPLWDWHSDELLFEAAVRVCALGREMTPSPAGAPAHDTWGHIIARAHQVPALGKLSTSGHLGDRADLNANFRDQYYGMVPAVFDAVGEDTNPSDAPALITTGLIDPGVCYWGERPARFAKRTFLAPRVDLGALSPAMVAWAQRKLVPKVLVANQTRVIEAVADPSGAWLPGVPITSVTPHPQGAADPDAIERAVWEIAAVLTSPVATCAAWWTQAGSGLSARAVRIGPSVIAATPWPAGDLGPAVRHLRAGRIIDCGQAVGAAFGLDPTHRVHHWWAELLR